MSKTIFIKLKHSGRVAGPFTITDEYGSVIASDVEKNSLINGIGYVVEDNVNIITLSSTGGCKFVKTVAVTPYFSQTEIRETVYQQIDNACLYRHLTNISLHNSYYGTTYPYIIEYVMAYSFQDQILQNIKDYSKVFQYIPDGYGVFNTSDKIEVNDVYFNKLVVYNGQQSSGIINLVPKPKHNLSQYTSYPIYNSDSKTVLYTKSDNFYQINNFFDVVKDKTQRLFIPSCESLSIDKEVNQSNMDYGYRSFNKSPLRAKDSKTRMILDNTSAYSIVSQFIVEPSMISYK